VSSRFISGAELALDEFPWGTVAWRCRPANTGSRQLVVMDVTLVPGGGHDFHRHPDQEELIIVTEGRITQFLEREPAQLGPGDCVYIDPDVVHASFNPHDEPARLLVTLSPSIGEGYQLVDVAGEEPWRSIERPVRSAS
jgi:quercetin dioxygenase-like cupin family protein